MLVWLSKLHCKRCTFESLGQLHVSLLLVSLLKGRNRLIAVHRILALFYYGNISTCLSRSWLHLHFFIFWQSASCLQESWKSLTFLLRADLLSNVFFFFLHKQNRTNKNITKYLTKEVFCSDSCSLQSCGVHQLLSLTKKQGSNNNNKKSICL